MSIGYTRHRSGDGRCPEAHRRRLALACGLGLMLGAGLALAQDGFCSATATALFRACHREVKDDFFVARARCINVSDDEGRRGCSGKARTARKKANKLCRRQRQGRLDACRSLGEERYDPKLTNFDPALFDDPRNPIQAERLLPAPGGQSLGIPRRRDRYCEGPERDQGHRRCAMHRGARPGIRGRRSHRGHRRLVRHC
jgi:hypothetical protein